MSSSERPHWPTGNEQLDVLIIENDRATAHLTREAFREAGLMKAVVSIPDGDEALAYLRREGAHKHRPHPDLIFLDLHLPRKSGLEVLAEIKRSPRLLVTPVVVVSGSDDPKEIREAYELHASCYIRKPNDLHQFLHFIKICFDFWGSVVTLPPKPDFAAMPSWPRHSFRSGNSLSAYKPTTSTISTRRAAFTGAETRFAENIVPRAPKRK
jgi:chemotaxis family two-component system response regulator Rcp1